MDVVWLDNSSDARSRLKVTKPSNLHAQMNAVALMREIHRALRFGVDPGSRGSRLGADATQWQVTLPIYIPFNLNSDGTSIHPYLHHLITARQPTFYYNQSSPSLSSICHQTLSLFSWCQDDHWIQIIMHMLIFETNYILSIPSFRHSLNSILCSPSPSLTNYMPLETKYSLKVLLNHTYF